MNRLCSEKKKPKAGEFHEATVNHVNNKLKRNPNQELSFSEVHIPKAVTDKLTKLDKLELMNQQVRKIEQ